MKKSFTCNYFPKTDGVEVNKRTSDIDIRLHGRKTGDPSSEYWVKTVVLTPEDAVEMAKTLKQLASQLGVEEPELPQEADGVEVFMKETVQTKVTPEQIAEIMAKAKIHVTTEFEKCTVVTVQLENGFTMTESSGCVDPANYDVQLGMEICLKRIQQKVWELEGYALQKRVHEEGIL